MNRQRIALLITGLLGVVSTFKPWAKIPLIGNTRGTDLGGWVTMTLFFVVVISAILGDRTKSLSKSQSQISLIASIVAGIYGFWKIMDLTGTFAQNGIAKVVSSQVSIGAGLYLIIIAAVASAIMNILLKDKN